MARRKKETTGNIKRKKRETAINDNQKKDSTISVLNRTNDLHTFIENSTFSFQFSLIALHILIRDKIASSNNYYDDNNSRLKKTKFSTEKIIKFSSRELIDKYTQLARSLGLINNLSRAIAFPEWTRTLLYLGFMRETEDTSEYECPLTLQELAWLASLTLSIIEGRGFESPPQFQRLEEENAKALSSLASEILPGTFSIQQGSSQMKIISNKMTTINKTESSTKKPNPVTPRSRDYGKRRDSYFQGKQPPTVYNLRKPTFNEISKLQAEFDSEICNGCGRKILLTSFDIWLGSPMTRTPSSIKDQRMTNILANTTIVKNQGINGEEKVDSNNIEYIIDSKKRSTEREILELGYGIVPMDGRDGFIAFAKPIEKCPICGYNIWNSISISPNF